MIARGDGAAPPQGAAPPEKTSAAIANLVEAAAGGDVTVGAVAAALKDRGFGVFMVLFALPNVVIPGLSFILGAPVLLFALQLAAGREQVWLPEFLRRRTIGAEVFRKMAVQAQKFLIWTEKRVRPRWTWLVSGSAERVLGLYIAIVAAFLMMPVPFGNLLPALGIALMSAGLIEKDGKAAAAGIVLGFIGALYIGLAFFLGFEAIKAFIAHV